MNCNNILINIQNDKVLFDTLTTFTNTNSIDELCAKLSIIEQSRLSSYNAEKIGQLYINMLKEVPSKFLVSNPNIIDDLIKFIEEKGKNLRLDELINIYYNLTPDGVWQFYESIPDGVKLPQDLYLHNNIQQEWYFLVGTIMSGNYEISIELQLQNYTILPQKFLEKYNLEVTDYQIYEFRLALTVINNQNGQIIQQYYKNPMRILSGQIPIYYRKKENIGIYFGNNYLFCDKKDDTFPLNIKFYDKDETTNKIFGVELLLDKVKPLFMQGEDNGCTPCMSGIGSLYYSYPRIKVLSGKIQLDTTIINLDNNNKFDSTLWFDHQWSYGFKLSGIPGFPQSYFTRALTNITNVTGWSWFELQFNDNTEITAASFNINPIDSMPKDNNIDLSLVYKNIYKDGSYSKIITTGKMKLQNFIEYNIDSNHKMWFPTQWILFMNNKKYTLKADYNTPIRTPSYKYTYREGPVTIYDENNNIIGKGFAEGHGYLSKSKQLEIVLDSLGSSLQQNKTDIINKFNKSLNQSKINSKIYLILLFIILLTIFILSSIKIIQSKIKNYLKIILILLLFVLLFSLYFKI